MELQNRSNESSFFFRQEQPAAKPSTSRGRVIRLGLSLALASSVIGSALFPSLPADAAPQDPRVKANAEIKVIGPVVAATKTPTPTKVPNNLKEVNQNTNTSQGPQGLDGNKSPIPPDFPDPVVDKPDLRVTAIDVKNVDAGEPLLGGEDTLLCVTLGNSSPKPANHDFLAGIAVDGAILDGTVGSNWRPKFNSLGANLATKHCFTFAFDAGQHTIKVVVDEANEVAEWNESNNSLSKSFEWASPLPDLVADTIEVEGKQADGTSDCDPGKNTVTAIIKNSGKSDAQGFLARLLVDDEEPKDDQDQVTALSEGGDTVVIFTNVKMKKGDHTIKVLVDAENAVLESDESNNTVQTSITCVKEDS